VCLADLPDAHDPALGKIERFRDFLEARKALLAAESEKGDGHHI